MTDPVLAAHRAGHSHDGTRWQFRGLDMRLGPGEIMAVLGPNGCGKSTLLKVAAGLRRPTEGRVARSGRVAVVPQHIPAGLSYPVLDMVVMGRAGLVPLFGLPGRRDHEAALAALNTVGLAHLAQARFDRLSGGERQLVLIARALVAEPRLLLLDEPASALDLHNQGRVLRLIRGLAERGMAVMFSTHQPDHALAVAGRVLLMSRGVCRQGSCAQTLTPALIAAAFDVNCRIVDVPVDDRTVRAFVPLHGLRADPHPVTEYSG